MLIATHARSSIAALRAAGLAADESTALLRSGSVGFRDRKVNHNSSTSCALSVDLGDFLQPGELAILIFDSTIVLSFIRFSCCRMEPPRNGAPYRDCLD